MSKSAWLIVFALMLSMLRGAMAQDHYAVLIGVETYDTSTFNNLQFAGDDAVALSMQLERLGFKTTTMTSESESSRLRPTTPKKITDVIEAVGRSCAKDDTLVIALSGHGVQFSDEELLPTGVRETYFCPSDASLGDKSTLLRISSIVDAMNQTKASRKLLLVDACQENVLSSQGQKKGGKVIDLGSVHESRRTVPGGIAILFSCSDKQFSWEHQPLGHSVFTYHVIEYLRGSAQARYYDEGKIELNGLVSYVAKNTNDYVIQKRLTSDGQFPVLRGNTSNWTLGNPPTNPMRMTNSLQMEFALIPAGTFQMGTRLTPEQVHQRYPGGEVEHYEGETQHQVKLTKSFYLGVNEVTVGQFRKFVEVENYKTDAERDGKGGWGYDAETGLIGHDAKYSWRNPGFEQDDKHPVVNVSWNDAVAFCKWLSRVEGRDYRLPTEAEWEYSCRAGSSREFTFGDDAEQLVGFGNIADASLRPKFPTFPPVKANDGSSFTSRVGSYRSNEFGLHDMHGNVLEWCSDWYGDYPTSPVIDPVGPAKGSDQVVRGGSWRYGAAPCRSASRFMIAPSDRNYDLGFRVALSSSEALNARNPNREGNVKNELIAKMPYQSPGQLGETLPTITNSIGMKMKLLPAGKFMMGSNLSPNEVHQRYPGGIERYYEGETPHQVKLTRSFYIGVHEVTGGQFRKFVEAEGYKTDAERDGKGGYGYDAETGKISQDSKYSWRNPGFEQDDKHPVVNVSWNDAVAFCKWLSRVEGRDYRLPTEAEWEYSCRAGSSREFTFGDDAEQLVGFGNVADASLKTKFPKAITVRSNDGSIFTSRVGSYRSNEFGLHDMHGNVYEWCSDWYGDYPSSAVVDPVGPATGSDRVSRGGSWCYLAADCRSADRSGAPPVTRSCYLGFRLALSSTGIPQSPEADK